MDLSLHGARAPARIALGPRELLLASAVLVVGALVIAPVTDVDYWWHVQTGRLQEGSSAPQR